MTRDQEAGSQTHLNDAELFTLAVPPAGEPEALPRHLSECLPCSRALSEWKSAVRELGEEDAEAISRRLPQEWEALEGKTLAAIRRSQLGRRRLSGKWMTAAAAAVLFFVVALPMARSSKRASRAPAAGASELSPQDQADDALLRDVARLARGEEGAGGVWNALVPEPEETSRSEEDRL